MSLLTLARRHAATLTSLGLHATDEALSLHAARAIDYRGVRTEIDDDAELTLEDDAATRPELADPGAVEAWLAGLRDLLAGRLQDTLGDAEAAVKALVD